MMSAALHVKCRSLVLDNYTRYTCVIPLRMARKSQTGRWLISGRLDIILIITWRDYYCYFGQGDMIRMSPLRHYSQTHGSNIYHAKAKAKEKAKAKAKSKSAWLHHGRIQIQIKHQTHRLRSIINPRFLCLPSSSIVAWKRFGN